MFLVNSKSECPPPSDRRRIGIGVALGLLVAAVVAIVASGVSGPGLRTTTTTTGTAQAHVVNGTRRHREAVFLKDVSNGTSKANISMSTRARREADITSGASTRGHHQADVPREIVHFGGSCLDAAHFLVGAEVRLRECVPKTLSPLQAWTYDADQEALRIGSGLCFDADGKRLHVSDCDEARHAAPARAWAFDGKRVVHIASKKCLGEKAAAAVLVNCSVAPEWGLVDIPGAQHLRLGGPDGRRCLHVEATSHPEKGNPVGVWDCILPRPWVYNDTTKQIYLAGARDILPHSLCMAASVPDSLGSKAHLAPCAPGEPFQRWQYYGGSGQLTAVSGLCAEASQWQPGGAVELRACDSRSASQHWKAVRSGSGMSGAAPPSVLAPVQELYIFRAMRPGAAKEHPLGDVNAGNMEGVMWYLMNEVVTQYTAKMACPRKFGIGEVRRYRVRVKQTQEMAAQGHHFGVRFAYDRGLCVGRCFPGNNCTCTKDCDEQYRNYGYVVGCNNFRDHYPFPDIDTQAPGGVWYSLPLAGKCAYPSGAHDCTWSEEDTGVISLAELERLAPGDNQCCDGVCTDFWTDLVSPARTAWRVAQALDLFVRKYPGMPRDLEVTCDFNRAKWYANDVFKRGDPWDLQTGCMNVAGMDLEPLYAT